MSAEPQNQYVPDEVSPPGETLLDTLQTLGLSQKQLAERTGRPLKTINEIVKGKAAITPETALQLEKVLGVPASFWNNREAHYREYLARQAEDRTLAQHVAWLRKLPFTQMVKLGWIEPCTTTVDKIRAALGFFGVATPDQWQASIENLQVALRLSPSFECDSAALSAWLRAGEVWGRQMACAPFDADVFEKQLLAARCLTLERAPVFQRQLKELFSTAGVAVVFVPELPRTHVQGATRWLSPSKALIQLSLRYRKQDVLWFTFFHEAGHILLHSKKRFFLETEKANKTNEELEANEFAANMLIDNEAWLSFVGTELFSREPVRVFAKEQGIDPGIVVGRLQHEGRIPWAQLADMRRGVQWDPPNKE